MDKSARVRECLRRAGLSRLPPGDADDLGAYGLDSLLSVLTVIELQKEFGITIPASAVMDASFDSIDHLVTLIPD
jgi:acyl carrier protein